MVRKSPAARQVTGPVNARKATEAAFAYFFTLFPKKVHLTTEGYVAHGVPSRQCFANALERAEPSLEEIEMSKDERFWLVTIGYNAQRPRKENLPRFLQVPMRKLKVFKVDAATGRVLSMKIPKDE